MQGVRRAGLAALLALTVLAGPAMAQAVDQGSWINLFDGETLFGWTVIGDAPWAVEGGSMACSSGSGGWIATTSQFRDFELTAKIKVSPEASTGLVFRGALEGHPSENGSGVITIVQPKEGGPEWHDVSVIAKGNEITATLDGQPVADLKVGRDKGCIGIQYHHNHDAKVAVSEVKLRPLALQSIFNGKDLSGWNIIPEHKSEFSVVDGAMNIKNGNGQIETAGVYKDFLLQLDIMANGVEKPLNSGVFFRTPVGVFWKGYESQIRNEFKNNDRTQPNDYGTGGNYGNQDARKVVPTEREWFTKTIVADGNHAAVWINGYQVSDFTDTRPVAENNDGKSGYVPGPGTINLQGHDPTTDMFFKNINIQDYAAK